MNAHELNIPAVSLIDMAVNFATVCQRLAGVIVGKKSDNLTGLLNDIPPMLGLKHLAYVHIDKHSSDDATTLAAFSTYSKEWQLRYFTRGYAEFDPIFAACRNASASFDWRSVRESSMKSEAFFADAADYGLGENGCTIRVPAKPTGNGMVSFNSDLADSEWEAFKDRYMGKLEVVACLVDSAAGRNSRLPSKKIVLSKREHQALFWVARGRTASEAGEIMGVSYATARSHLESARRKLDCENVTHSVATALAIGLLRPTALKGFDSIGYTGKEEAEGAVEDADQAVRLGSRHPS